MNVKPHLLPTLLKYGIENDESNKYVNLSEYLSKSSLPVRPRSDTLPLNPVTTLISNDSDHDSLESGLIAANETQLYHRYNVQVNSKENDQVNSQKNFDKAHSIDHRD